MIIQISPLGKHLPKAWGGCAEPYPQGSFGRNGQRPTQHWCPVRDGKSDALRWGVFAAPFFDAHRVQACYRSGDPLSAAQPSLQCGRDAAGLVVSDGAGSGANRDDSTAATERCLSVFDRAALLSGSLHDAPLSVASGPAGPVATESGASWRDPDRSAARSKTERHRSVAAVESSRFAPDPAPSDTTRPAASLPHCSDGCAAESGSPER